MLLQFCFKHDNVIHTLEGTAEGLLLHAVNEKIVVLIGSPGRTDADKAAIPAKLEAAAKECRACWHQFVGDFIPLPRL